MRHKEVMGEDADLESLQEYTVGRIEIYDYTVNKVWEEKHQETSLHNSTACRHISTLGKLQKTRPGI